MSKLRTIADPLHLLPSEIVLRILDFTNISTLATLTRLNRDWNSFIDKTHKNHIYSHVEKTQHPDGAKDFSYLADSTSFSKHYQHITSWKDLCKSQTLLARNWNSKRPVTRESTIRIGDDPIWRFRPDFKRRFFLSTSHAGGMKVTDMDSGALIFQLDRDTVRPFAHLEYQDGTAVWDREGDVLEVWRTDDEGSRGAFHRVTVLPHEWQTRGFQLSYDTLCVASSQGKGAVYDLSETSATQREIEIEDGAIGHLDQDADAIVYSIGVKGYHFYGKHTGRFLGHFHPEFCKNFFHVKHPDPGSCRLDLPGTTPSFPPQRPARDRTTPLHVEDGAYPRESGDPSLDDDEWGACMLSGRLMAGISRGGRVFVCPNWREALKSEAAFAAHTFIVECVTADMTFDLGGWLSVRSHRIMFEVQDQVYVLGLTNSDHIQGDGDSVPRPSFAFATSLEARLAVPISFMSLYDDCIMSTYTTICSRPRPRDLAPVAGRPQPWRRVMPTKAIRVLSFAENESDDGRAADALSDGSQSYLRQDIHRLIAMLAGDPDDEESDGNSE
ncbi:hypothetical protein DOTSEDRAFT_87725 [Dothistroma septosporum NZE10]|uniref:F-box domain-containing protein n=1 Tax=Dothistroma septosporum (strain NZE10 / CBS 128990) TaxID=675120 RepID=N1PQY4_DOTSN|nr:hypothetical protein DOTSEDRAFT_87725 [Dothistroma septosporum NZE10]